MKQTLRLALPLVAAAALNAAQSDATASSSSETIELSPFTVVSERDSGYRAQNTLAGSRLNSALADTPGVLDVLTKDFMDDIGATTIEQALDFSTNFSADAGDFDSQGVINSVFPGSQAGLGFRTRGLGGTLARNYLETDFRPSFYTVERIDNSSGPNSILFGLGSAGGIANISTKRAKLNRSETGLDLFYDSYGSRRISTDVNRVIASQKLGFRINVIRERNQNYRANFSDNTDGMHLAGTWRIGTNTEVRAEFELARVSGSVAYMGPQHTNPYVSNWLGRGSPVYDLPTNWETLTTAARNALVNPTGVPTAFNFVGAGVSPVVVQNGEQAYIINAAASLFSNSSLSSNDANNRQSIDPRFFNPRGNVNGPGGRKGVERNIAAVAIDHKISQNLYVNLSASREAGEADTYQAYANGAAAGATILIDGNGTLTNPTQIQNLGSKPLATNAAGQVVNPFAGQFYTQSRWLHRTQDSTREVIQGTAAWQVDLGRWFGNHRVVATASYSERSSGSENFRDSWLYAPLNNDPTNTNNGVVRRRYASPLDPYAFHVPDWREFPQLTWNHPTKGPITTGWVTEGENLRLAEQLSYLVATQSTFFNRRLILTAGYRVDEATDYVYDQKRVFPAGWETSNGLLALDRDNIAKTTTRGPTRTIGGVVKIAEWLRVYANKSTNFGPPRGNVVGPDAVTPPNTAGKGLDTGVKLELLDNKLFLDLGYFDTSSNDVTEVLTLNLNTADSIRGAYNAVFPILNNPMGTAPLFNSNDAAAVEALKAKYPLLRPVYNANADMLDQASRGYEVRLIANLFRGMRLRATFSKTERDRENLYKYTLPMAEQLREFIKDLQAKNPGVNVGSLATTANPTVTVANSLDNLDLRLDNAIDSLSNNFGGGKLSANLVASYDFQRWLKGLSVTVATRYKSGAYTGAFEVREGGVSSGRLLQTIPHFGQSTIDWDAGLRYRMRPTWLRKTAASLQFHVYNLFNVTDPIVRRRQTMILAPDAPLPPSSAATPTSYFLRTPRRWTAALKFDF